MTEIFNIIPGISSGISLAAFAFAIYSFLQERKMNRDKELILSADLEDRPNLISQTFSLYKIPEGKDNLTSEQRFDLIKIQLSIKSEKEKRKTRYTFFFGIAILAVVAFQIYQNNRILVNKFNNYTESKNKIDEILGSSHNSSLTKMQIEAISKALNQTETDTTTILFKYINSFNKEKNETAAYILAKKISFQIKEEISNN